MAMTPNPQYGRFVGRVGALAVALGIGAAIANSPGVAMADDGQSASSESSTDSATSPSADSPSEDSAKTSRKRVLDSLQSKSAARQERLRSAVAAAVGAITDDDDEKSAASSTHRRKNTSRPPSTRPSRTVTTPEPDAAGTPADDTGKPTAQVTISHVASTGAEVAQRAAQAIETTSVAVAKVPASVTTQRTPQPPPSRVAVKVLSVLGGAPQANSEPVAPAQSPALWAMLGFARRELGHTAVMDSPLGTPEQLEAERIATETVNTVPVRLMKVVLKAGFLAAAYQQFPGGPDAENLAALDEAVDEFALAAAFQQQLLDSMNPKFITQVAPPHTWYGQSVGGTRILYDNPDTIYRFTGVSASSEYVITGQFHDVDGDGDFRDDMPADTSFSVLEGTAGTTSQILVVDEDFEINDDGTFEITVSSEPGEPGKNHLQLTPGSTIIASRNTLGDWNAEAPMTLDIERVGGPPDSLFAQLGGFTFLGSVVNQNPALVSLVSVIPPLPYMPPVLRGTVTAVILVVRGVNEQAKYMELATAENPNEISQPASNAEFLANQLQSNGQYELADDEALVVTIDPGDAGYFIVPTYNDWTITDNYWDQPTSLNNEQAIANPDGTYTFVISPTDPGVQNWVSTGGLNQGLVSIRFQKLGDEAPRIVSREVMTHDEVQALYPAVTPEERQQQLEERKAGYDKRWAPYPQV
ncbi:DUF1214 domain-containing protein [Mycobacterium hubeiense]|uniref:DUF1214 domain-containing protein n=1 Tax=Mycobacterium hubeiense TaxID=1867256 RepID=UPI000C7F46BC|nr:DUF1214 domain-containing protein [Mycobacterium sp. QGD 101]